MRRRALRWLVVPFVIVAASAKAETDPIDQALAECTARTEAQTTAGMLDCARQAIGAWDRRLNEAYRRVLAGLDSKSQELLRTAQRRWLAFYDAERAAQSGPWSADRGSLIRVEAMQVQIEALKERIRELQLYLGDER